MCTLSLCQAIPFFKTIANAQAHEICRKRRMADNDILKDGTVVKLQIPSSSVVRSSSQVCISYEL